MSDSRNSLHEAYLLHSREYRESSLLLEVFSREHGRLSMVAKAARSPKSRYYGNLQLFVPVLLSWSGKGELLNLVNLECVSPAVKLRGRRVLCGYYVNELIMRLLHRHDPHEDLFDIYASTLTALQQEDEELVLRRFERQLLQEVGYGLNLEYDSVNHQSVVAEQQYYYDAERGPYCVIEQNSDAFRISGQALLELAQDNLSSPETRRQAKQLMRRVIDIHLGNKPLRTRAFHWYKAEQTG